MTPQLGNELYFEMSIMSQHEVGAVLSSSSRSVFAVGNWQKDRVCVHLLSAAAVQRVVHEARARDPTWSRRAQVSHAGPPRLQLAAVDVFSRLWGVGCVIAHTFGFRSQKSQILCLISSNIPEFHLSFSV